MDPIRRFHPAAVGDRYCTQHKAFSDMKGGMYKESSDGLRQSWVCYQCLEADKARKTS